VIHLGNPWALLALGSLPIIIALHRLRPRRRHVVVSTITLWEEALFHHKEGLGLQRLLKNVSLLLLLLTAATLSLGLSDPYWVTVTEEKGDTILVLDTSASMKAKGDSSSSRFDKARQQAISIIDGLAQGERMLLISSARQATLLTAFETDRDLLRRRLSRVVPTDEIGHPRDALTLALSLMNNQRQGRIYFLTDAAFGDDIHMGSANIEFHLVTGGQHNVGITRFDFRPEIGFNDRFQVLLTLQNFAAGSVHVPLRIFLGSTRLMHETVNLAGWEKKTLVRAYGELDGGLAHAYIEHDDDLAADNKAYAVVGINQPLRVALFTLPGQSFFLQKVFDALPNIEVQRFDSYHQSPLVHQENRYDVMVFDGVAAPTLASGSYLLINTIAPDLPFSLDGWVSQPKIESHSDSALVRGLDFTGIRIDRARRVVTSEKTPGLQRLLWSADTDLALTFMDGNRRIVFLGFDPGESSFPVHAAFPLLLSEALAWLHPTENRSSPTQVIAGIPVSIMVPSAQTEIIVTGPQGHSVSYQADGVQAMVEGTSQAGFYHYDIRDQTRFFAVNLTSARESDIRPRAEAVLHRLPAAPTGDLGRIAINLWPYLAGVALLALMLEWWLWCGRHSRA